MIYASYLLFAARTGEFHVCLSTVANCVMITTGTDIETHFFIPYFDFLIVSRTSKFKIISLD